jgi:hypothetical protein
VKLHPVASCAYALNPLSSTNLRWSSWDFNISLKAPRTPFAEPASDAGLIKMFKPQFKKSLKAFSGGES